MIKVNLIRIYEDIYMGVSHCALCYRSCKQRRLVRSQVFKKIVEVLSPNTIIHNATLCYMCEAQMTKFAYLLDSVQTVLSIHRLFMKAETSRFNIPLEKKLRGQNINFYQKKLMQFREKTDLQNADLIITNFVEDQRKPRSAGHRTTCKVDLLPKNNSSTNNIAKTTKKTVQKQNKQTIEVEIPPLQPKITTPYTLSTQTNPTITIEPLKQLNNTNKVRQIMRKPFNKPNNPTHRLLTGINNNKQSYMPVLTIDGSSGSPKTHFSKLPLHPNLPINKNIETNKEKSKIMLPTMVCQSQTSKESVIDLENAKRIYEDEPARKKMKLNMPQIYVVKRTPLISNTKKIINKPIFKVNRQIHIKNEFKPVMENINKSILPKIVDCRTDSKAFITKTKTEKQTSREPLTGEIDWEAKIPSEVTTFVDCGEEWPSEGIKEEHIDIEYNINSDTEDDNEGNVSTDTKVDIEGNVNSDTEIDNEGNDDSEKEVDNEDNVNSDTEIDNEGNDDSEKEVDNEDNVNSDTEIDNEGDDDSEKEVDNEDNVNSDADVDNEDDVNSDTEVDNFDAEETSIIIVEDTESTRCSVCALELTTETLKEHFINVHMKPPVE